MLRHPSGKKIKFDAKKHRYTMDGKDFLSATRLIYRFFPKFDRQKVSKKYAKKHNLDQKEVLLKWRTKGKKAKEVGDRCHLYASNFIESIHHPNRKKIIKPYDIRYGIIADVIFELLKKHSHLYSECIIFSIKFMIAGMFDLLFYDHVTDTFFLYDWKFVEDVEKVNQWETGLFPILHLDNSRFNKFALQLNLYKYIIETEDYFKNASIKLRILHVTEHDYEEIEVPDMKKEIKDIIIERERQNGEA